MLKAIECSCAHGPDAKHPILAKMDMEHKMLELYCRKCKKVTRIGLLVIAGDTVLTGSTI